MKYRLIFNIALKLLCFIGTHREEKGEAGERGGRWVIYSRYKNTYMHINIQELDFSS